MSFTVRYLPDAEQELAALWMDSLKRDAVTKAAHRIDQQLQQTPEQLGESRPQDCRIYFDAPLAILFRVLVSSQLVEVVHVWEFD
ncbi:MAG TPA: type II toxin-antitoxin system RelE/ParE family toxin [Gemmataceae bacterium]|jgi:hypothetical protein